MSRLFLSHSSANNAEAVAIRDWLASEGWNEIFLDLDPERGIAGGERWERALNDAASRCEAVIFLISRHWLDSRWCLKEFNLARKLNKRLFGVLVEAIPMEDLPPDLTSGWQIIDLASGRDHLMLHVVLPRTQEEVHITFSKEGLTRLRAGLAKAGLDPRFFAWPPEHDPNRPPYRGLKPLEAEDAGIFFGRDAPIVEALDTLRGLREGAAPRLLVNLGASGAGKSSFLRAGLWPRLARDDRNFLTLPVIRPDRAALSGETGLLRALETALAERGIACSRAQLREAMAGGADSLRPWLTKLVDASRATVVADEGESKPPVVTIAIDQAEELFLGEGGQEALQLLSLLRDLAGEDRPGVLVLFSIRSDSYDRLETAKPLEGVRQQVLPLLPMPRGAYQIVIEGPAARLRDANRSLIIEPQLTQRLLEEIDNGGGSDALPLLAFTLELLYLEYGGTGALRLADYEKLGGIRGAIEAGVERALAAADADPRIPRDRDARLALLRAALIPWLAGIDPETGSPRRRVARLADIPEAAIPLVNLLVQQRLLATDRVAVRDGDQQKSEITIEPAHEALLRQWSLLRGWLEEDFSALATLEGVKRAARDWAANDRRAEWLNHAGTRLEDAEEVMARADLARDLSVDARDYLRQCRAREQAEQQERIARLERERAEQERQLRDAKALAAANRRTAMFTGAGLVVALLLAALAGWETLKAYRSAQDAAQAAQEATAQRDRAQGALHVAMDEMDKDVTLISSKLQDLVGASRGAIRGILTGIENQFDTIAKMNVDSAQLQSSRARIAAAFVDVFVATGEFPLAQKRAGECVSAMRPLVSDSTTDTNLVEGLGLCLEKLGDAMLWRGYYNEAVDAYRESVALRRRVVAARPADGDAQIRLAHALSYDSYAVNRLQHPQRAESLAAESLSITSRLVACDKASDSACDKDNPTWQREYAESINFNAIPISWSGRWEEALKGFERAREIAKDLLARDQGNARLRRYVSNLQLNVADAMLNLKRYDDAAALLEDSLKIKRDLVASDPENSFWRYELAYTLAVLGTLEGNRNRTDDALANLPEAVSLHSALLAKDPDNIEWQLDLAGCLARIAAVRAKMGGNADVVAYIDDAIKKETNPSVIAIWDWIRGRDHLDVMDYNQAILDFGNAIRLNPGYSWAYYDQGRAYFAQGKIDETIQDIDQAIALGPRYASWLTDRGWAYYQKHDYDHAAADFDRAIKLDPDAAMAFNDRGVTRAAQMDYDGALADYGRAIEIEPKLAVAYGNRGMIYEERNDSDHAMADYDQAIALGLKNAVVYNSRGTILFQRKDYDRSIADLDQAILIDPKFAIAYNRRGLAYYNKQDLDHALADYSKAIELSPSFAVAYNNRGHVYFNRRDYDHAIADYGEAIRIRPQDAAGYEFRANAYARKGADDDAIGDFDQAILLNSRNATYYYERGNAYLAKGNADEAIKDYDKAIGLNASYAEAYNSRGLAYFNKQDYDRAITDYSEAIRVLPNFALAYSNRGNLYFNRGDDEHAIADYSQAIRSFPGYAVAYAFRGNTYLRKGDEASAIKDYDQAIAINPNYADAYNSRGLVHFLATDYDAAIGDFDQAIRLNPNLALAYANRGAANRGKGDYDRAVADLDAAIRLAPNLARAYYNRGNVYRASGKLDRTQSDYAMMISLAPADSGAYSAQCWIHLTHREWDAALADCRKSLELRASDAYALDGRGFAHLGLGRPADALADFEAALKVEPRLAEALYGRGVAKQKTGDASGAEAALAAATAARADIVEQMRTMGM